MKLSLIVQTEGKAEGQVIPVTLAQFIIGRDPQCNLRPASALISKRHCALLVRNGEVFLRDFDSTNGTFLNETPVKGEVKVSHQDALRVGPLLFKVAIQATANATPAPPAKASPVAADAKEKAEVAKQTKAGSDATHDDDIAALLLLLPGDDPEGESTSSESGIPSGSTVMDIQIPKEVLAGITDAAAAATVKGLTPQPENKEAAKKEEKKEDKKMDPAHMAAKAILDKYSRRGRG